MAKDFKTDARSELHAATPPLKALRIVLQELATGDRRRKFVALMDVRQASFYNPARRRVFAELPPEDYQPAGENKCGFHQCRSRSRPWERREEPDGPCVWRCRIGGNAITATVHGGVITMGGERKSVEELLDMFRRAGY